MLTPVSFRHGPGSVYSFGSSAIAVVGESTVTYGAFTKGHDGTQEDGTPQEAVAANDHGMIEAKAIHERLRTLQALGNEMRLEFLDALRALHDDRLCFELGYSSFHQYCDRELGLAKSTSYEYLKVGKAFGGLPGLSLRLGADGRRSSERRSRTHRRGVCGRRHRGHYRG